MFYPLPLKAAHTRHILSMSCIISVKSISRFPLNEFGGCMLCICGCVALDSCLFITPMQIVYPFY